MHPLVAALLSPHTTAHDFNRLAGMQVGGQDLGHIAEIMAKATAQNVAEATDRLEKASRGEPGFYKSEFVGTQLQGQAFTSTTNADSQLAPIVPQSMSGDLVDLTIDPDEVWLSKHLTKVPVYGLIHERAVQTATSNRPFKTNFIAEGGSGSNASGSWARRIVQIRFEADRDEISDVAMLVRAATETGFVTRGAMEVVRKASLSRLVKGRERNLWLGNNTCDPRSYDGLFTSVAGIAFTSNNGNLTVSTDSGRVSNLEGAQITFDTLLNVCESKRSPVVGTASRIRHIVMLPRAHASLIRQAQAAVRYEGSLGMGVVGNTAIKFYSGSLKMMTSYGDVEITAASMMMGEYLRNSATAAGGTDPGVVGSYTPTAAAGASVSKFLAGDAGDYWYRVTGVGANGETIPTDADAAVTVAAGDVVTIEVGTTQTNIDYWVVERSPVDAANTDNSRIVFTWPKNAVGAAGRTRIIDANIIRPNTSPVAFLTGLPGHYELDQLLPTFFKPLAQTGTTFPFLMLDFASPFFIAPELQHVAFNAGFGG